MGQPIGIIFRVFTNGPVDLDSIPGQVILRYGSRVKWGNPGKGVAPSLTSWCSSYGKVFESLLTKVANPPLFFKLIYGIQLAYSCIVWNNKENEWPNAIWPTEQVLLIHVKVNLGVMAMMYSTFLQSSWSSASPSNTV